MYVKECLINIGISKLPPECKYVAWIDPGVEFENDRWIVDAIQELKTTGIIQLFDKCKTVGREYQTKAEQIGFVKRYFEDFSPKVSKNDSCNGEPGLAWAANKKDLIKLKGFIDFAIGGGGSLYMANGFLGELKKLNLINPTGIYMKKLKKWEKYTISHIDNKLGYLKGGVIQFDFYKEDSNLIILKEKALHENNFDPDKDLKKDRQGLYSFNDPQSPIALKLFEITNPPINIEKT